MCVREKPVSPEVLAQQNSTLTFRALIAPPATAAATQQAEGPRVPLYRHTIWLASWRRLNPHISVIHNQCVGVCGFLQDVRHQESTTSESGSNRHCPNVGCADSFKKNTSYFSSYTHSCLMRMFTFLLAELSLLVCFIMKFR